MVCRVPACDHDRGAEEMGAWILALSLVLQLAAAAYAFALIRTTRMLWAWILIATALVLILGTLAGYALGRLPMRGKFPTLVILLMISVFPEVAVIAPLYLLMRNLHLLNSYPALIIPYTAFFLPFAIWILRNYFLGIPREMEETGRIDGASPLRTVWTIVLPQALPGLFTAGIFTFTACWTEFLMALTFDSSNNYRTIPVGIAEFGGNFQVPYGTIFAASVVAVVPIGILVFIFRKFVISGLTSGAVKG